MFAHFLAGMIVWCAYCQRLIREVAPLTRYDISHGVCATCAHDMHLRPADVMLGLIQPALVEIGHSGSKEASPQPTSTSSRHGANMVEPALRMAAKLIERGFTGRFMFSGQALRRNPDILQRNPLATACLTLEEARMRMVEAGARHVATMSLS